MGLAWCGREGADSPGGARWFGCAVERVHAAQDEWVVQPGGR